MTLVIKKTSLIFITLLVAGSVISGCGRRGPLEAPPAQANVVSVDENGNTVKGTRPTEEKPFILDALL